MRNLHRWSIAVVNGFDSGGFLGPSFLEMSVSFSDLVQLGMLYHSKYSDSVDCVDKCVYCLVNYYQLWAALSLPYWTGQGTKVTNVYRGCQSVTVFA